MEFKLMWGKVATEKESKIIWEDYESYRSAHLRQMANACEEDLLEGGVLPEQIQLMRDGQDPNTIDGERENLIQLSIHHEKLRILGGRLRKETREQWLDRVNALNGLVITDKILHRKLHDVMTKINKGPDIDPTKHSGQWRLFVYLEVGNRLLFAGEEELLNQLELRLDDFMSRLPQEKNECNGNRVCIPPMPKEAALYFKKKGLTIEGMLEGIRARALSTLQCWPDNLPKKANDRKMRQRLMGKFVNVLSGICSQRLGTVNVHNGKQTREML